MVKKLKYLVLLIVLAGGSVAFAQPPSMSYGYYTNNRIANRDYDYETLNRKRMLESKAANVEYSGLISYYIVGGGIAGPMIATLVQIYSPWWVVPVSLAVGLGSGYLSYIPFSRWSKRIKQQADAIDIRPPNEAIPLDLAEKITADTIDISEDLNKILGLYKEAYTVKSSEFADCLMWGGMMCQLVGDNEQAQVLMEASCILFKEYGNGPFEGRDTINEIFYLDLQSKLYYDADIYYKACQYAETSCQLKRDFFGDHSEVYLKSLLDLSKLHTERLNHRKAQEYHNLGYTAYVELIRKEFCEKSESERTTYWASVKDYISKTLEIASLTTNGTHPKSNDSINAAAYNALLLSKGLLLNTTVSFENFVIESGNEKAIATLNYKKQLSSQSTPQTTLDSLDYVILTALKASGQEFHLPQLSINWKNVRNSLGSDDLAVEFFKNIDGSYGALLLKQSWNAPKIVLLDEFIAHANKTEYLNTVLHNNIFGSFSKDDAERLWAVSKAIWCDDIIKHFPTTNQGRIFFAADNEMLVSGIEYLPIIRPEYEGNKVVKYYCISDIYNVYRLTSTRELVTKAQYTDSTAVIYGGLLYNLDPVRHSVTSHHRETRSAELPIPVLEGTRIEADSIVSIINRSHSRAFKAIPFVGSDGTEASFKALNGASPSVIHIGTHGFFYSESDSLMINKFNLGDNPLSHSGLFLSGADSKWFGDPILSGEEDGFLTALEISSLDLRGLDLVVLSACETGKGDIRSDGVFGLQRGFKMAGANSILMSLWKVDDAATCLLMTEFYRNWINIGMSKHDALETARQAIRSHTEKGWDNPKYWAAFIMLDALD